jgi:hypothetical protein
MAAPAPRALRRVARLWIIATVAALGLVMASLIVANVVFQRRMVRDIEDDQLTVATQRRLTEWAIGIYEADLAEEVVRLARSEDLREAIALGGREALREQLEPPLNRLRKSPLAISRITLYAPDGRLLVHAHDLEDEAPPFDDRGLLKTAMRERRIVKGIEMIGGLPHLLAASPIYRDGKSIGLLEMGTSLAPITRSLRSVTGAQVALRLAGGRVIEASSPEPFAGAFRTLTPGAEVSRHVVQDDQKQVVISLIPLTAFSGEMVAHLALVVDASRAIATLQKSNAVTFVIASLGFALAGGLLLLLSRRLARVHASLERLHATADEDRERAERRAARLSAVSVMTRSIASSDTPEQAGRAVADAATDVLGAALTRISIEGPQPGVLHTAFTWGTAAAAEEPVGVTSIPAGGALISRVFASGVPEYRVDIQAEREWLNQSFAQTAALHAYAGLPLVARGRVQGVMSLLFSERREFTSEEKELMLLLADSVAIAVERSRAAARSLPAA